MAQRGTLDTFKHDDLPLNDVIVKGIKLINEDLTRDDLLQRCLGANTQNNNES